MPRQRSPALTDAEARIMAVLWRVKEAPVSTVVTALRRRHPVTYSTAQTLLRILEKKGYVTHEKIGRAFVYRPLVNEHLARQRAIHHLVGRLFDGSFSLLVLNVLKDEAVDQAEIDRLKKLIEQS